MLHGAGRQRNDLLLYLVRDVCVHGGATRQNFVGIEVFVDVDITIHDGTECSFVWLHGIPYPGRKAGREPQGNRTTSCQ